MQTSEEVTRLRRDVLDYAERRGGKIYAPICHPAFADIPYHHGHERFEVIERNLPRDARTALDVGAHWGYFCDRLEQAGLRVTAVENNEEYLSFLYRLKALCNRTYQIVPHSVFDLDALEYDVVLALNIFHHFIKTLHVHEQFTSFLGKLQCRALFFQAHNPAEGQMRLSYRNYSPEEFAAFLSLHADLPNVQLLANFGRRPMFLLTR